MSRDRVIIVHLRRPNKSECEKRSDPFWEFGRFGITGCHHENLMKPKNADKLKGVRLAFAQGGNMGTRLVYLTPPVKIVTQGDRLEAQWSPHEMPFRYCEAPLLAGNEVNSDFPRLEASIKAGRRKTIEGRFSSRFRSRTEPLEDELSKEIIVGYTRRRNHARYSEFARSYVDALPSAPPNADCDRHARHQTYTEELERARSKSGDGCGRSSRKALTPRGARRTRPC